MNYALTKLVTWHALAICMSFALASCTSDEETSNAATLGDTRENEMKNPSEQQIVELAKKKLAQYDRQPDNFEVNVIELADEWQVDFTGREPSPPGSGITVFLDKEGQVTDVILGE